MERTINQNILPNHAALVLGHIRQVRMMLHEGRQVMDCHNIIKDAQRDLAYFRWNRIALKGL